MGQGIYWVMIIKPGTDKLLARTNFRGDFLLFLQQLSIFYPSIGQIEDYEPILIGYEDANFVIITDAGKYVLKMFLNERSRQNILDYVEVLKMAKNSGVNTIKLVGGLNEIGGVYFMLTEFFEGVSFEFTTPTLGEMLMVTDQVSLLNTIDLRVEECYDSFGNKNLIKEFSKVKDRLSKEVLELTYSTIQQVESIDWEGFSKSLIHGDVQRKHVLYQNGEYLILDFGCMSYDYKVFEISTLLAWFCFSPDTWPDREEIFSSVIAVYTKRHLLSPEELQAIWILTLAAYCSYFLRTWCLINLENDESEETLDWYNQAKQMLILMRTEFLSQNRDFEN